MQCSPSVSTELNPFNAETYCSSGGEEGFFFLRLRMMKRKHAKMGEQCVAVLLGGNEIKVYAAGASLFQHSKQQTCARSCLVCGKC